MATIASAAMIGSTTLLESEAESPGAGLGLGAGMVLAGLAGLAVDGSPPLGWPEHRSVQMGVGSAEGEDTALGEAEAATATVNVHWTRSISPSSAETDVDWTS